MADAGAARVWASGRSGQLGQAHGGEGQALVELDDVRPALGGELEAREGAAQAMLGDVQFLALYIALSVADLGDLVLGERIGVLEGTEEVLDGDLRLAYGHSYLRAT